VPEIGAALRSRLDATERQCKEFYKGFFNADEGEDISNRAAYDHSFADSFMVSQVDRFFDDALIALSRVGGKLSDLEIRRLQALGYWGDPAGRLAELLATPD